MSRLSSYSVALLDAAYAGDVSIHHHDQGFAIMVGKLLLLDGKGSVKYYATREAALRAIRRASAYHHASNVVTYQKAPC